MTNTKHPGRPRSSMTDAVCDRIVYLVRAGELLADAAVAAGVSHSAVRQHRRRNAGFRDRLDRAESDFEVEALRRVRAGGRGWRDAAKLLERRYPDLYGDPAGAAQPDPVLTAAGIGAIVALRRLIANGGTDIDVGDEDDAE